MTGAAPIGHLAPRRGSARDRDQADRLRVFRERYPDIEITPIREGGMMLQARIPEPDQDGETLITRHELRLLLDKLADMGYPALPRPRRQS